MKKSIALLLMACALAAASSAQDSFPGLKAILTAEEWQRAGLDRLTPDQLGVIDAALIRQQARAISQAKAMVSAQHESARQQAMTPAAGPTVESTSLNQNRPRGWLERFGLPVFNDDDWRALPPLRAKVVAWAGGNRFRLDNGQLWEGFEAIPYELVGKEISIHARPGGQYALSVEGNNTMVRVLRLR